MPSRRGEAGIARNIETPELSAAQEELSILDKLADALSTIISDLTRQRPQFDRRNEHTEVALHERKYSSLKGYQELAHHSYGRTVVGREIDERGRPISEFSYRITQANVGYVDGGCVVLARNNPIASKLVTTNPGDEREVLLPKRTRFLRTDEVRIFDGPISLLSPSQKPNFRSMLIRLARAKKPITVQNLRAFVNALTSAGVKAAPIQEDRSSSTPTLGLDATWFNRWQSVYLGDSETSSLGHQFFTRTTPRQEAALNNPRGVTFVEGIAGAGKTSVALGRLKFFANFGTGEQLEHYGLVNAPLSDFAPVGMVGFVLSHSLKRYLKETAIELGLEHLPIRDFQEFRVDLSNRFGLSQKFKRSKAEASRQRTCLPWLRAIDAAIARAAGTRLRESVVGLPGIAPSVREVVERLARELEGAQASTTFHLLGISQRVVTEVISAEFKARELSIQKEMAHETNRNRRYDLGRLARRIQEEEEQKILSPLTRRLLAMLNVADLIAPATELQEFPAIVRQAFGNPGDAPTAQALDEAVSSIRSLISVEDAEKRRSLVEADLTVLVAAAAMMADGFEYSDAPAHLHQVRRNTAAFIDEVQDFTEIEILLMGMVVTNKYHQITLSGDRQQRLQALGTEDYKALFPAVPGLNRNQSIFLDHNFRQREPLAALSAGVRYELQGDGRLASASHDLTSSARVHVFHSPPQMARLILQKIREVDANGTVAVICPTEAEARRWYDLLHDDLSAYHRPALLSHRDDLTRRIDIHFTEVRETKGLEFDVVVIPDLGSFRLDTVIGRNQLYVAITRPKHALLIGCDETAWGRPELVKLAEAKLIDASPISSAGLS
jgi:UvrD-like helicase family protein